MAPAHSPCGCLHVNYIHRCQYYHRLWLMTRERSSTAVKCTCMISILTILRHCGCEEFNNSEALRITKCRVQLPRQSLN